MTSKKKAKIFVLKFLLRLPHQMDVQELQVAMANLCLDPDAKEVLDSISWDTIAAGPPIISDDDDEDAQIQIEELKKQYRSIMGTAANNYCGPCMVA